MTKPKNDTPEKREARLRYHREHYKANKDQWLKRYGITSDGVHRLLRSQDNGCAICGSILVEDGTLHQRPHIDHDHETGNVRGLLCGNCNVGLGMFKDNPALLARAIVYLERGHV